MKDLAQLSLSPIRLITALSAAMLSSLALDSGPLLAETDISQVPATTGSQATSAAVGRDTGDYEFAGADEIALDEVPVLEDDSDFETNLWIDGWIVQLDIGIQTAAMGLSKSVFLGFDDIIRNLDWIVPLGADIRYKRVGFMPDLVALGISGGATTPGPFYNQADVEVSLGILNIPIYYRLIDQPGTTLDVLGGTRFLWVDLDIGLTGGLLGGGGPLGLGGPASAGTNARIWDGIVGLRLEQDLTEKLFCLIYADVGTGNSDLTWQTHAGIGYQFTENFSLTTGYRYIHYDLGSKNTNVELTGSGVQLTLNWTF